MNVVRTRLSAVPGVALAMILVLGLGACGKSSEPATPATPAPAPVTAAPPAVMASSALPASAMSAPATAGSAAAAPIKVTAVNLGTQAGKDYKVTHPATHFGPDDHTLYAAVDTTGSATGANLGALWSFEDGQTVNQITQSITTQGPATTTFKVHNSNAWPPGKYTVAISLDGKTVERRDFQIGKP